MEKSIISIILGVFILLFMGACLGERTLKDNDSTDQSTTADVDSMSTVPDDAMCFLKLDGTKHQDSTYVYIRLKGDSVSGIHHWVPDMKDARRGVITGTKRGDTIDVVWNFMQEGISDTLHTVFLLENGYLKQQPYAVTKDGRQVWDRNAPFQITYKPTTCPKFE